MARLVKVVKKSLALKDAGRRRSKRIAKLAPINGFKSRKPIDQVIVVHLPSKKKSITKSSKVEKKLRTTKSTPTKKTKVAKERTKKIKNEKLVPRNGLIVHEQNPYFFVKNHVSSPTGLDVLESVRYAHRLVEQKDIPGLKKLVADVDKFPKDGVNCGFSVYDRKSLLLRAILKDDEKLIDAVLALEKEGQKDSHLRDSLKEKCILQKMTTGQQNIHMLGHRTAHIEMTRGSRQGNNALILHDDQVDKLKLEDLIKIVGDKLDFGIIQKLTSENKPFEYNDLPVWAAIRTGNRKLAAYMIEYKAKYYFNQLHINTLKFNNQTLPKFMPISTTKKAMNNKKITPVHTAAINENVKYLKEIAAVEPVINQPDVDNWYTIHYAAVCVGSEPLKYLIERGALVTILNKQKESPLHCAARAGRVENIKILINAFLKIENQMPSSDEEMDISDEEAHSTKKSKKLPPSGLGTYLNAKNTATMTPLHLAVSHGQHEVVEFLLKEKDVQVDSATSAQLEKVTPLMTAARRGDLKMVRILIDQGHAWIDQDDKFKRTALIHAVLGGQEHVVAELAKRGAGISTKPDSSRNSAVHYAAAYGWLNIVKVLELAEPACLTEKNAWHLTPLTVAFLKNHMEIVSYLLDGEHDDVEINIDDQDNDGNSILLLVLKFEDKIGSDKTLIERLNYLKEKKADVILKNSAGLIALHYFANKPLKLRGSKNYVKDSEDNKDRLKQKDYLEILDFLSQELDSETVAIEDEDGNTALELALDNGNFLLAEKLFSANNEAAIRRWKKVVEENGKERERTIFHRFIDAIFAMNGQANADDCSVYEYQLEFSKFFEKILEKIRKIKVKDNETLAHALASKYNTDGRTPLLHLLRRIRELNIPIVSQENSTFVSMARSIVPQLISIAKLLIKIDKELIFMRELEADKSPIQSTIPKSYGWNFNQVQESPKPTNPFRPNAFELSLVGQDRGFIHHFKLLDEQQKIENPWIKMMVDEMDAEQFERAMIHQDERFGFKGHSPLLYCIEMNHVDTVYFLLSICEKYNLTTKICALTLEKVLGNDGKTYETVNKTALLLSIEKKQMGIAEFLVSKTNQAKNVDEQGRNAFHYLARMPNEVVEFFEMLANHGLQFITDRKGRRPLHYAVATLQAAKSSDISTDNVEYLLAADSMATEVIDVDSRLPIHYCFVPFEENWKKQNENKSVEVQQEKTRKKRQQKSNFEMEVDSNGIESAQPLELFGFDSRKIAKSDPIPVISLLLKQINSESLSTTDKYGNSVLHYAAAAGANICLLTLLHKIRDINAKNAIGNSPLAIAVENGHDSAAMTLIQAGSNVADKFYGPVPKPSNEKLEKWKPWPLRSEKSIQRENTILSLIVRNGWQGIIYIVLDRLNNESEYVFIELLAAAVEHKQLNLAHSLMKKLNKFKNLGHRTIVIFENLANGYSASANEIKLFEALIESGFSWTNVDGTSLAAEKFAEKEHLHGLNTLKQLDRKHNDSENWKKLLQSASREKIMKELLKAWNGSKPRDYLLQLMSFIQEFADKDHFSQQLFEFNKPAFPGMEKVSKKKPESEIQNVTALIYAIQTRKYGLIEFLLGKMANVNATDENGLSPMMHAIMGNDETAIKILLRMKNFQYKEINSEENTVVQNGDDDGNDNGVNCVIDDDTEDSVEEESAESESEESEDEIPRKRMRMLLAKKKKSAKKAPPAKTKNSKKNAPISFKNSKVEIFAVDKAGNNILHYLVTPNGYENVEMAKKLIQAEPMLKTLLIKPNLDGDSPLAMAAKNKQKMMFNIFCNFLTKNQIDQRLVKLVEFPSELDKIQGLECPFNLERESTDFIRRQTEAQRIVETEEEKRKKEKKPHRLVHNAEISEIVEDDSTNKLYKVLMQKTDVNFGVFGFHNYYRMQLVQRKRSNLLVLFTHWGRIGDEMGQCQHTPFSDKDLAIKEFKSIFKQKSGNDWDETFIEKNKKYRLVQIEENPTNLVELQIDLKEKSDESEKSDVSKIMKDLSNVQLLKNKWAIISGSISQNLPFGRITKEKLLRAQEILEECRVLETRKSNKNLMPESLLKILKDQYSLTNEFYMQIAVGSFAFGKMKILDSEHTIKQMENIIKQLFEFEIAAKLVTAAAGQTDLDPFEFIEIALETRLTPLNSESVEAQRIMQCIANSSPNTKVTGIFSIMSKSSVENFDDSGRLLHNHKYLWHGTKSENLLSILKVGLLASPPHAVMSGNLYGEGLYFSDIFEKSRNYCNQSAAGYNYALLCEVALGDVYETDNLNQCDTTNSKNMDKKHTLKVLGQNIPNDNFEITTEKGVRLPLGSIQARKNNQHYWTRNYSEYIAKDRRNVNIRYLIQFQ